MTKAIQHKIHQTKCSFSSESNLRHHQNNEKTNTAGKIQSLKKLADRLPSWASENVFEVDSCRNERNRLTTVSKIDDFVADIQQNRIRNTACSFPKKSDAFRPKTGHSFSIFSSFNASFLLLCYHKKKSSTSCNNADAHCLLKTGAWTSRTPTCISVAIRSFAPMVKVVLEEQKNAHNSLLNKKVVFSLIYVTTRKTNIEFQMQ